MNALKNILECLLTGPRVMVSYGQQSCQASGRKVMLNIGGFLLSQGPAGAA